MNNLQIFKNKMFGTVRTMTSKKGEILFVDKDVAQALGYSNTRKALIDHVENEDRMIRTVTDSMGRTQRAFVVNESGLYALILSSKLPQAKAFKRWVTSEVLPRSSARAAIRVRMCFFVKLYKIIKIFLGSFKEKC